MADGAENRDKEQGKDQKPQAQISFFVRNEAAHQAMKRRKVVDRDNEEHEAVTVSWNWRDTWQNEHKRAFVVAKMAKADLLTEVRDSLQKALDEGVPFEQWKKEIVPKLEGKWLGKSVGQLWDELSDEEKAKRTPPSEKEREKVIGSERLELIFRTNMAVANAAGHYEQLMKTKAIYPYWRYVTRDDARVRDAHRALHNKVFKWDDPFWETYFPPNGFRCRCHVSPLTKRQVERDPKLHIEQSNITEDADGRKVLDVGGSYYKNNPGWDYNPGDGVNHLVSLAKSNEKGRPAQVQADLEADLAKREAEEAAAAKAKAEAEKARQERERQAQEVEKRLQEAQARAEQRRAEREAKKAERQAEVERTTEAQRLEKEAAERQRAAETTQKEAQQREADQRRDAEVQRVLRQAREVQGAPVLRQTAKTAEIKIDTYAVQDKVRLRKGTPVPAKEERRVVNLASDLIYQRKFEHNNLLGVANLPVNVMSKANNSKVGGDFEYYTGLKSIKNSKRNTERASIKPTTRDFDRFNHLAETALPPEPSQQSSTKESAEISFEPKYHSVEEAQKAIHNATREHAVFFDENGKCLFEIIGTEANVSIDPSLLKGVYLVIHNHPKGNIFSPNDIIWAIHNNIHEMRVLCNGDGAYSFYPQKCNIDAKNVIQEYCELVKDAAKLVNDNAYSIEYKRRFVRIYASKFFPGITELETK